AVRDLREWISEVEKLGELSHITKEVDWDEEMAAITYMVGKQEGGPALLFENIKGYRDVRALWNPFGSSRRRIALALDEDPDMPMIDLIKATMRKMERAIPPHEVDRTSAPVNEHVLTGDQVDLLRFPVPRHWPLDGGRYLGTADSVITRNPDGGNINLGTYRMMVQGKDEIGLYLSPGKDARLHLTRMWEQGKEVPVCAVVGVDPLQFLVSSQGFPKNVSEYDYVGGLRGEPVEVVRAQFSDLLIPARADIVIECVAEPHRLKPEGPFGEFTGYYGRPEAATPLLKVKAIHHRNHPILTNALMADYPSCEQSLFFGVMRSARIWSDLEKMGIPGIKGVYSHPAAAGGFGAVIVSLEQRYAGHVSQALSIAAQCPGGAYYTKWIIAVEEDVDPTDMNQVLWAMTTRCNPAEDIDILRNTWSTWLDPTQNPPEERPWGSKALVNACREHRYLHVFSKRTAIRKQLYEKVSREWADLGLKGSPPPVRFFHEEDQQHALVEADEFRHGDGTSQGIAAPDTPEA
ncbi:MAG: UbiD family decarboxylase, partial [Chloroflexota bacterium]|nr:UbiD family decarboxylase [Chloroflexota bacterium]